MAIPGHMDGKITCLCESLIRNDQLVGSRSTKNGQIIKIETQLTINDKYFNYLFQYYNLFLFGILAIGY